MEEEIRQKPLLTNGEDQEAGRFKDKLWTEIRKMWIVAGPATFTRFTTYGVTVVSQAFIGHIGSTELAAYSIVFTVLLTFANGVLLGTDTALQTLCGQAYGAKQYHMLGIYLQRSWIILLISAILLLPLFIFTTPILKALGQDASIAETAGYVAYWFIPVFFAYAISYSCQMFLQAQSKNMIIAYLAAITIAIHLFLSWLLTVKYKFGLPGAMSSTILAYWIPDIGQLIFITCGGCKETWKGFTILAFKDIFPIIKMFLSSGVMICLECWYSTTLVLLIGNMKNADVSLNAMAICLNVNGLEMMIAMGFLAAASVRVSNELGRGSSKAAKFSIWVTVLTSFLIGSVLFALFLLLKGRLAYLFTERQDVAATVGDLSPLLAVSMLLNSVQPVLCGVAVGAGRQSTVAYINIGCFYLIGVPVEMMLGYLMNMAVKGVWLGMILGLLVQTLVLAVMTWKTDWNEQVVLAHARINKWFLSESR